MKAKEVNAAEIKKLLTYLYVSIVGHNKDEVLLQGQPYNLQVSLGFVEYGEEKRPPVGVFVSCPGFQFNTSFQELDVSQREPVVEFELMPVAKGEYALEVILLFNGEPLFSRKFPVKVC